MKFYICNHCKNIITYIVPSGVKVFCCGEAMTEIIPGSVDAAVEKHVPVVKIDGSKVTVEVGSVEHPMIEAHYINFIAVETKQGSQIKYLKPGEAPKAEFVISEGDEYVAADRKSVV